MVKTIKGGTLGNVPIKFELLIFDLDGTLIDSRRDIANSVNYALKTLGLRQKSIKTISSYIGWGVNRLIKDSLGDKNRHLFKQALNLFTGHYRKFGLRYSNLYPNVSKILEYFKDKNKVVITNRNYEFAERGLKKLKIDKYFDFVLGADNLKCIKPSPCPLNIVLRKFKSKKDRAIVIGDMDLDVISGKRAGIATCAVTYGIGSKNAIRRSKPDYMINNIIRLKEIIK